MERQVIKTVEMHTGGQSLRIIVSGYPPVHGATILDKRSYVHDNLDYLRTMLMSEPRGHKDMYGALLVETDLPNADIAVLFLHNEGYSTMCGHAVISLGRYVIDYKLVKPVSPETKINIQCPCGLISAYVKYDSKTGQTGSVRFESVPSFAVAVDKTIEVDSYGVVTYDLGYGGAYYALVDVLQLHMDLSTTPVDQLEKAATAITNAVRSEVSLSHPENADLAFLYGTILTDSTRNICVYADRQVDRSPCGSGVTTRTAVQYHKGETKLGLKKTFMNGKTGSKMTAMPIKVEPYGCYDNAVVVEVSGNGHYLGESSFWIDEGDPLANGFLIQ